MVKNPPAKAVDAALIPALGRFSGKRNGNTLQYSCLGNLRGRSPVGCKRVRHDLVTQSPPLLENSLKREVLIHATTKMNYKNLMLSERSHSEKIT